ncbi:hypothetical protein DS901_02565 [Loktanella sp. D2R18]|jgi:hypothetical protein|uniref:hypothetical protein n=1 Tax=Rhodobacterales TaxID=204455 RepID=UPI000DEB24D8|nr:MULTISPECIES: hypothetical protein [Rhodobacterales]MDO6591962.1 hypothetical protein [Yoonia sp. 1_MG-2023]RBW45666.1 hypothetical protein DS901_02565 [Loktanella sp. D2R18]
MAHDIECFEWRFTSQAKIHPLVAIDPIAIEINDAFCSKDLRDIKLADFEEFSVCFTYLEPKIAILYAAKLISLVFDEGDLSGACIRNLVFQIASISFTQPLSFWTKDSFLLTPLEKSFLSAKILELALSEQCSDMLPELEIAFDVVLAANPVGP